MKPILKFIAFFLLIVSGSQMPLMAATYKAGSITEFNQLKTNLQPGDTLLLASGTWMDAALVISNKGTANQPIVFIAERPGSVIFSGNSFLRLGGKYVEVNGLTFKNGYAKKDPIIAFREKADNLANNCRITNCVIDNYNNPDRLVGDHWVALFGKHNRFDHNYIANKKNVGTTLIVELNDVANQENYHRIDHNFFGERPKLGSNGGETIRIGTSTFSRTSSRTIVEDNYFYRCNGEVEIVSIKSGDNTLRRNTFYECEGGLVLRHGNRNILENNFFIGNHLPNTGGIRVINAGHKVYNNFFYRLAGDRFHSAMAILNGVPNSPINRYDPVKDVVIVNNVFVECKSIELSAGKDLERTETPKNVLFTGNVFFKNPTDLFHVNDDISGTTFKDNYTNAANSGVPSTGFAVAPISVSRSGNTWSVSVKGKAFSAQTTKSLNERVPGVDLNLPATFTVYATENNTGVTWYKALQEKAVAAKTILVLPGENTLTDKVQHANAGDTLLLAGGEYQLSKMIIVNKPIIIAGKQNGDKRPVVQFKGEQSGFSFFSIENGGSLQLKDIVFNGLSDNGTADNFVRTSLQPMIEHYSLYADGCDFLNITDGRKNALKVNKGSYADTIQYTNCLFNNISGDVINIAAEKEDKGIYNAEYVIFKNCLFNKILVGAIDVYRGGNDESTTGPYFIMDHCTFNEVANIELGYVIRLTGVQHSKITNSIFNNSGRAGRIIKYEDYGWTRNSVSYINAYQAGRIESFYQNIIGRQVLRLKPEFTSIENLNFKLMPKSPLKNKGNDGKDLGCVYINGHLQLN